jgi:hypothetical protein
MCSSETWVELQRTAQRCIPGGRTVHNHRSEDLKSYIGFLLRPLVSTRVMYEYLVLRLFFFTFFLHFCLFPSLSLSPLTRSFCSFILSSLYSFLLFPFFLYNYFLPSFLVMFLVTSSVAADTLENAFCHSGMCSDNFLLIYHGGKEISILRSCTQLYTLECEIWRYLTFIQIHL